MATVLQKNVFLYQTTRPQIVPRILIDSCKIFGSLCAIPVRTKFSKTSPFGKRQRQSSQRDKMLKANPNKIKAMSGKAMLPPIIIDTAGEVVGNYVPLPKKTFFLTPTGLKQIWTEFKNRLWTLYSVAFIKKDCKPFKLKQFAKDAQEIFIGVNEALIRKDKRKLQELATGPVYYDLRKEFFPENRQLYWRFVKELTRPRVVYARVVPVESKDNLFAQVTVKVSSEQVIAVKDQYGHLLKGSDKVANKLTDYIVFERHISNKYGTWRVCGKVHEQS